MPIINNIFFISNGSFETTTYDFTQAMNYFTPTNEQQTLNKIVAELRNENVKIVTAAKNKKGKSLLSGTAVTQTSGVSQQTATQTSPVQTTQPLTPSQPAPSPATTPSPSGGYSGPSGGPSGFGGGSGGGY